MIGPISFIQIRTPHKCRNVRHAVQQRLRTRLSNKTHPRNRSNFLRRRHGRGGAHSGAEAH